ncbi:hypothetical protein [Halobacterium sp. R2-5]|uniref:hypothetical protein n=1 Tax=Halobacterium sp. R2-5 TaxID=2715751 RepID=UPI001421E7D6|nr:hypothetical protein [Halobacterium sp. R2-5]NIC00181.1 hypothetical protein [Halobacterium sp. R2-5]
MADTEDASDAALRRIVREEVSRAVRSAASTVVWTLLSVLGVLVGLQSVQVALQPTVTGAAAAGFGAGGVAVVASSAYLLYVLHAE